MNTLKGQVAAYYERFNRHAAAEVAELFAADGTFEDPASDAPLPRDRIAEVTQRLLTAFPDAAFEPGTPLGGSERCAVEWTFSGTNLAALRPGVVATGKEVQLRGVDIFESSEAGILRLQRHFDQQTFVRAMGLQVIVEPYRQNNAVFGYSMHVSSGASRVPGVLGLTWIRGQDEAERDAIRGHARQIIGEFQEEPGFIGIVTGFAGDRGFTVTAWEDEAALERALSRHHSQAKLAFRTTDIARGVWTSVWKPIRTNGIWSRCPSCSTPNDVTDNHRSCVQCGAELPPRPPVW